MDPSTYFLRPASPGRLIGRGRILERTGEIVVVKASLADKNATVATATATATIVIVSINSPDPVGDLTDAAVGYIGREDGELS